MASKKYNKNEHNLPIPRLQIRILEDKNGDIKVTYSLIKETMIGVREVVFHNSDYCTSNPYQKEKKLLHLLKPYNSIAEIMIDMWLLKLPGYVVSRDGYEKLTFEKLILSVNQKLWDIMASDPSRKEEMNNLKELSKRTINQMKKSQAKN